MKISRRVALVILLLGLAFFIGLLFPSFVQDNVVTPVALVLWLFWRILQSVDQALYWLALIFLVVGYFFARLFRWSQDPLFYNPPTSPDANAMLERISYWQSAIRLASIETYKSKTLEQDLGMLLAALYASRQPEAVQFVIYDKLKARALPLPEDIHAFLFPAEATGSKRPFTRILRNIRDWPRKRIRRWTGREKAEYFQALDQVLTFMESAMENEHDDKHLDSAQP